MRSLFALGLVALLCGCAPRTTPVTASAANSSTFRAVFSSAGVAWLAEGKACVARAPSYQAVCPRLGRVTDIAWNAGEAWAAVPGLGLIVTLDRAARTVPVGAVVALSSLRVYREDGSALTYAGQPDGTVPGTPSRAVTGGDGQDYVLLGKVLMRVADQKMLSGGLTDDGANELVATPTGMVRVSVPSAYGNDSIYRLQGGVLERRDIAGQVLGRVPHAAGAVGLVGEQVVTVTPAGEIRRFTRNLQELR